jgi:hypothetical protein
MIDELVNMGINEEEAFFVLFSQACGLDIIDNSSDLDLAMRYFKKGIRKLDVNEYVNNPYYKNITVKEEKIGDWEFRYEKYKTEK